MDPFWTSSIMESKRDFFSWLNCWWTKLSIHHINWSRILSMNWITGEFISHSVLDLFTSPTKLLPKIRRFSFIPGQLGWLIVIIAIIIAIIIINIIIIMIITIVIIMITTIVIINIIIIIQPSSISFCSSNVKKTLWFWPHANQQRKRVVALSSFARCLKDGASPCHWSGPQSLDFLVVGRILRERLLLLLLLWLLWLLWLLFQNYHVQILGICLTNTDRYYY